MVDIQRTDDDKPGFASPLEGEDAAPTLAQQVRVGAAGEGCVFGKLNVERTRKHFAVLFIACAIIAGAAHAAQNPPLGAWQTTNQCFMAGFLLNDGGRAQAAYMTGETDDNALWTWDGSTLTITSRVFDLDKFSGRLVNGGIEADYVWHNNDTNQLNHQSCAFERVTPSLR